MRTRQRVHTGHTHKLISPCEGWLPRALLLASLVAGCDGEPAAQPADASAADASDASTPGELGRVSRSSDGERADRADTDAGSATMGVIMDAAAQADAGADEGETRAPLDCALDAGADHAQTRVEFECTRVLVESCANIDQVRIELSDGAVQSAPGKHSQRGEFAGKGRNAGKTVVALSITTSDSGMRTKGQAQQHFVSPLSADACAPTDAGPPGQASAADGGSLDAGARGPGMGIGASKAKGKAEPDAAM